MSPVDPREQHEAGCPKLHGMTCACTPKPVANPPPSDPILQFFTYEHLRPGLREISQPFSVMAHNLVTWLPRNPERTVALRKLLEAKDCAVRAYLFSEV